jgi:protein-S-isoprenylcysteine O-methyltransferase Ste14
MPEYGRLPTVRIPPLGSRGQGWVLLQVLLLLAVAAAAILVVARVLPHWPDGARAALTVLGAVAVLGGITVFLLGATGLGSALTADPKPLDDEVLRTHGLYAHVRHPIYSGLVLTALGAALLTGPWTLVPVALLAVELDLKRRLEEEWLLTAYADYAAYRARVTAALVPGLW